MQKHFFKQKPDIMFIKNWLSSPFGEKNGEPCDTVAVGGKPPEGQAGETAEKGKNKHA